MSEAPRAKAFETSTRPRGLVAPIALLVLCAFGVAVSGLSTRDHVLFRASGGTQAGACDALIESGCKSAHSSAAAEVLGIPISHFGTAFYLAGASLAVLALRLRNRRNPERASVVGVAPVVTAMGIGAVAYSVFLATLLVRSGEACPLCIALYAVNVGMLVVGLAWWSRGHWALKLHALFLPTLVPAAIGGGLVAITTPFLLDALSKRPRATLASASLPKGAVLPGFTLPMGLPSKGGPNAEDDLVEFSDLDCSHCALMHRAVSSLLTERGPTRLRVRFVSYPLDQECNPEVARSTHPTACLAARGAICAQEQGRFWQYAEAYFAILEPRSRELIFAAAQSVGVAMDRFVECLDAEATKLALAQDIALSQTVGVRATPTLLVNGRFYEGAIPRERLEKILNDTKPCGCERCSDDGTCATATVAASAGPVSQR
jgi:protein-disulfide isomerase/uncharacterized membrane protein